MPQLITACSFCCAVCMVSWPTWLLFTGVHGRCVVLRVRCPGPLGSCSLVCTLCVLCCVCCVLGHLTRVHRCARSVCHVACAPSWATWLLFTGLHARHVVLCVWCHWLLCSCSRALACGVLCLRCPWPTCAWSAVCYVVCCAPVSPCFGVWCWCWDWVWVCWLCCALGAWVFLLRVSYRPLCILRPAQNRVPSLSVTALYSSSALVCHSWRPWFLLWRVHGSRVLGWHYPPNAWGSRRPRVSSCFTCMHGAPSVCSFTFSFCRRPRVSACFFCFLFAVLWCFPLLFGFGGAQD